jgi:hypothetical protein
VRDGGKKDTSQKQSEGREDEVRNNNKDNVSTGCGRKKSPIWEANKFKTKEDRANVSFISGKYTEYRFKPVPHLFKALLQGQKHRVFFSGHSIYLLKQERFRAFRAAGGI